MYFRVGLCLDSLEFSVDRCRREKKIRTNLFVERSIETFAKSFSCVFSYICFSLVETIVLLLPGIKVIVI